MGLPQGIDGLAILFCFILYYFIITVYFHNTNQVLVGLPQGVGGLAILYYLIVNISLISYNAPGARRAPPRG